MYSNAFTHDRVHTDSGLHVAKVNDFKLVLRSSQALRAEDTSLYRLGVRGWAGRAVAASGFLLTENAPCSRQVHLIKHRGSSQKRCWRAVARSRGRCASSP